KTVVGTALLITWNQGVHCGTAGEHNVDDAFEFEDVAQGCQCGVLAEGVACVEGAVDNCVCSLEALGLSVGHHGERDLRELGEVQNASWVHEGGVPDLQLSWVFINDLLDGEAQVCAGVCICTLPHRASLCACGAIALAHALSLDALAWVNISGG